MTRVSAEAATVWGFSNSLHFFPPFFLIALHEAEKLIQPEFHLFGQGERIELRPSEKSFGLLLSLSWTSRTSESITIPKSIYFGEYCRMRPLVFPLMHLSPEWYGLAQ